MELTTLDAVPEQAKNLALRAVVDKNGYVSLERAIGGGGAIHTSCAHLKALMGEIFKHAPPDWFPAP